GSGAVKTGILKLAPRLPETGPPWLAGLAQEADQGAGERLGLLHVRQMGGRFQDYQLRALDPLVHDLRRRDGRALVLLADDAQGRCLDGADAVGQIEA